jgi:hypothetical protein
VMAVGQSAAGAVAGGVHGFAPALTSFVGRAAAVAEVAGLLEKYRLVMVTGPGGSGKTRLAAEVAGQVAGRFTDGVWLAELAAVRDPAQVPEAVAAALGVREQPGTPIAEALAGALADQQLLLVLDNCEHVIGASAERCAGLLPACDDVRMLATSREPLRIAGEARYRLGPLTLPGPDDPDGAGSEAVALFTDRARRAGGRFTLDGAAGSAVARLVRRLDGMPLAIELAAARVEALGVSQLLDRLGDRFALLWRAPPTRRRRAPRSQAVLARSPASVARSRPPPRPGRPGSSASAPWCRRRSSRAAPPPAVRRLPRGWSAGGAAGCSGRPTAADVRPGPAAATAGHAAPQPWRDPASSGGLLLAMASPPVGNTLLAVSRSCVSGPHLRSGGASPLPRGNASPRR